MYFSPYTDTTYTASSGNCPSFSCATSSSLLMLTTGPGGQFPVWRRNRKRLSVCSVLRCPDLWLQCSVNFVQHTESLFLFRSHLGNWPRSKHEKRTAASAWETWTVAAADGVRFARVRWEINSLLTFETEPFFCVYPVYYLTNKTSVTNVYSRRILYCPKQTTCFGIFIKPYWRNTRYFLET